jgi:hypothetical protein
MIGPSNALSVEIWDIEGKLIPSHCFSGVGHWSPNVNYGKNARQELRRWAESEPLVWSYHLFVGGFPFGVWSREQDLADEYNNA